MLLFAILLAVTYSALTLALTSVPAWVAWLLLGALALDVVLYVVGAVTAYADKRRYLRRLMERE